MTLAFLLTSLVIVATPGTGAIYTIGASCRAERGPACWRRSLVRRIRQTFAASSVAPSARLAVESR